MKLVILFLVAAMVIIFPADSRELPDKPIKEDLSADHGEHYQTQKLLDRHINSEPGVPSILYTDEVKQLNDENQIILEEYQEHNSTMERKVINEMNLRVRLTFRMKHKASGKYIRPEEKENEPLLKISSKVDSWNDMSFQMVDAQKGLGYIVHIATNKVVYPRGLSNYEPPLILVNRRSSEALFSYDENKSHIKHVGGKFIHPLGGKTNPANGANLVLHKDIHSRMEFTFETIGYIGEENEKLTKDISEMKIENKEIKKSLEELKADNTKLTQADSEMMKNLDALKADNTKLTQADSEMKKSLGELKADNTKLTQADSEMKKSLDALKADNTKLTQANSRMKTENQAIKYSVDSLKSSNSRLNSLLQDLKNKQDCFVNRHASCVDWAKRGECKKNPNYMLKNCKRACNVCGPSFDYLDCFVNRHASCVSWANRGECQKNPRYMLVMCKRACNVCGKSY